jgi:hypothetical protein
MANDLDKFTLQYQVDLKDSIRKLEELHKKMGQVNKAHSENAAKLKDFVADASTEMGKLVPGMNAVGVAVRGMGAGFTAAAAAVAVLAVSIKAVMDLRAQFSAQRLLGMDIGVSGTRVEEYQRKFVRVSSGRVDRDAAAAGLTLFSNKASSAYANPASPEARSMQRLGVNVGPYGGTPTGLNDQLADAAKKLQGMRKDEVQALAQATGVNRDWLLTLQAIGPEIAKVTEHTADELKARQDAEKKVAELNKDLAAFSEQITKLQQELGMLVVGPMTKFISMLADAAGWMNKLTPEQKTSGAMMAFGGLPGLVTGGGKLLKDWIKGKFTGGDDTAAKTQAAAEQADRDKVVETLDDNNSKAKQQGDQMALAINKFAGSVATFSAAVSQEEAWAAWAGEIGKAAGLRGGGNGSSGGAGARTSPVLSGDGAGAMKYFMSQGWTHEQAAGIAANLKQESNFNPSAVGDGGKAYGVAQWHPDRQANFKKAFGKDIRGSTLEEQYAFIQWELNNTEKAAGNRLRGATSASHAGGIFSRYYERPANIAGEAARRGDMAASMYGGSSGGGGASRSSVNLTIVQKAIADALGLKDVRQLQQGGVNRGDAAWAYSQTETGLRNHITKLKQDAAAPPSGGAMPQQQYAKLLTDIKNAERNLGILRQYGPGVVAAQQPGERAMTIGQGAIIININGAGDPIAIGQEVNDQIMRSINQSRNMMATGTKG